MPRREMFNNDPPAAVFATNLHNEMIATLRENRATKAEMLQEILSWKAAWYVLTGRELYGDPKAAVPYDDLLSVKKQLDQMGIGRYISETYMNVNPVPTPQSLSYEAFLADHIGQLQLEPEYAQKVPALLEGLNHTLNSRREGNRLSCYEYLRFNAQRRANGADVQYMNRDESVYEYEADDNSWQKYAAMSACFQGFGSEKMNDEMTDRIKMSSIDEQTMKNKRTVEMVNLGEYDKVQAARQRTKESFTFHDDHDFQRSKQVADGIYKNMANYPGNLTETRECQELLLRVEDYLAEPNRLKAAEKSAAILTAVENFTKGRKSKWASADEQHLVNQAMNLLAATVPDAVHNPSVQPLLKRFHDVRKYRLQGDIEFPDFQFKSALDKTSPMRAAEGEPYRFQGSSFRVENLGRQRDGRGLQQELYGSFSDVPRQAPAPQPAPKRKGQDIPVPVNLKAPEERQPEVHDKNNVINRKEYSGLQKELYGADDPEEPEIKEIENAPKPEKKAAEEGPKQVSVTKAFEPARGLMEVMKRSDKNAQVNREYLKEKFARMAALYDVEPDQDAPDKIDRKEVDKLTAKYMKDPAILAMADHFVISEGVRQNMARQTEKCRGDEKKFVAFMGMAVNLYQEDIEKNPKKYQKYLDEAKAMKEGPKEDRKEEQIEERQDGMGLSF